VVGGLKGSTNAVGQDGTASADRDSRILVDNAVLQAFGWILDTEGVGTTAVTFAGLAAFVLPVFLMKKGNVDSPDRDKFASL